MCSNCHANKAIVGKYGLSVDVVDNYLEDFHGITLEFYRMQKDAAEQTDQAHGRLHGLPRHP